MLMANILLEKTHKKLIQSAIALGDWLLSLDGLGNADREAIRSVQTALNKLPKINDGTLAMYGFSLEQGDEHHGLIRGWDVSLEYFSKDPERQGGLEMFSSYIPIPESDDPAVLLEKAQSEVYFHWPVADSSNLITPDQSTLWLSQIAEPERLSQGKERLRVEVLFGEYYAEIECMPAGS